jgi:hypothetical protein
VSKCVVALAMHWLAAWSLLGVIRVISWVRHPLPVYPATRSPLRRDERTFRAQSRHFCTAEELLAFSPSASMKLLVYRQFKHAIHADRDQSNNDDAMRKEPATRLPQLARLFAAEPGGIGLDEIAEKFAVGRRTAERMRDVVAEVFPQLEEIKGERPKRWRLPNRAERRFSRTAR